MNAKTPWSQMTLMQRLAAIGRAILRAFRFIAYGELVVAVGQWMILLSARIAETVMMFAVLWITANFVAPEFVGGIATWLAGAGAVPTLSNLSLISLSLLPEIILYSAVITTFRYWLAAWRTRGQDRAGNATWAVLYTIPTISFMVLTLITIGSFVENHGHINTTITGLPLVVRCMTGWFYGFVNLIRSHMNHSDEGPATGPHNGNQGPDTGPQPAPQSGPQPAAQVDHEAIIEAIMPAIQGQLVDFRASLESQYREPQVDYTAIANQVAVMLQGQLPKPQPVPQIDYKRLARELAAIMPTPEVHRVTVREERPAPARIATTASAKQAETSTQDDQDQANDPDREARILAAYQQIKVPGRRVSGRALAEAAKPCSRATAIAWLRVHDPDYDQKASLESQSTEPQESQASTAESQFAEPGVHLNGQASTQKASAEGQATEPHGHAEGHHREPDTGELDRIVLDASTEPEPAMA